jgi:MFS transporter, PHS family, inorganic phosphate transporter
MRQIYDTIDRQKYQWVVVLVAGVGFFLDGYTVSVLPSFVFAVFQRQKKISADMTTQLFAANIALPMIAFVYWQDDVSTTRSTAINIATLAGTFVGQLMFGFLADKKGRKKMYGVELLLLIASTLGVAMASTGTHDSMSIFAWLIWWRIMVGLGVGGDYPLSAVITSEYDTFSFSSSSSSSSQHPRPA